MVSCSVLRSAQPHVFGSIEELLLVLCVLVVRASRSRRDERVSFNASPCSVVWPRAAWVRRAGLRIDEVWSSLHIFI